MENINKKKHNVLQSRNGFPEPEPKLFGKNLKKKVLGIMQEYT